MRLQPQAHIFIRSRPLLSAAGLKQNLGFAQFYRTIARHCPVHKSEEKDSPPPAAAGTSRNNSTYDQIRTYKCISPADNKIDHRERRRRRVLCPAALSEISSSSICSVRGENLFELVVGWQASRTEPPAHPPTESNEDWEKQRFHCSGVHASLC